MWIFILIILLVIGIILFKKYDKDFITAVPIKDNKYHLVFETEKEADCILLDIFGYENKDYYVFIPVESLKKIPDEDIIILCKYRQKENKIIFNFADKEADEVIYQTVKKDYSNKYNFAE